MKTVIKQCNDLSVDKETLVKDLKFKDGEIR